MCRPRTQAPSQVSNGGEHKASFRSGQRTQGKNLREQHGKLDLNGNSMVISFQESPKSSGHKGVKKIYEQPYKKGKQNFRSCNEQRQRERSGSCSSSASTASLSDSSSVSSDTSRNIPQHVQAKRVVFSAEFTSRFLALDCEMVGVGEDSKRSALGRVSIVDWDGTVVFDTFVQVTEPVTDLRTFVSGLEMSDIDGSCPEKTMVLGDCVNRVKSILEGKILVGHALKNDLRVLGLSHPWYDVRDTTKYDAFLKEAPNGAGPKLPRKLKDLALEKLDSEIQVEGIAHSPVEDASAAMDLYKTVSSKWEKAMLYKKKKTAEIQQRAQQI